MPPSVQRAASREATRRQTSNEVIRRAGYGDNFFKFLAQQRLKVSPQRGAYENRGQVIIRLAKAVGDNFSQEIILPVCGGMCQEALPEFYEPKILAAAPIIFAGNKTAANRKAKRPRKREPQQAAKARP